MRVWLALALGVGGGPMLGCSGDKDPTAWIDEGAAVVHCTSAGRTRMPPVLLGLPFPSAPTGLYARGLDPMALGDMGFERDRPVCAGMFPIEDEAVEVAALQISTLAALINVTSDSALRTVSCACDTADALGLRDLLVQCTQISARKCAGSAGRRAQLQALLAPLSSAIETTPLPRRHWRLAGPTDRPGWFAQRIGQLLARYPGGSMVYLPGQAVPARDNFVLLRALLKRPDVVAVVRQDGGRALLVARVVGRMQVLDHFELPAMSGPLSTLRGTLDNARPSDVIEALDKPVRGYRPLLPLSDGNLAEQDTSALERIDAMAVAASPLLDAAYEESEQTRTAPKVYVERISVQAPFGREGRALRVRARLAPAGRVWATAMDDARIGGDLDPLGLSGEQPVFEPAPDPAPPFVLRGTAADAVLVHGLHSMARVLRAIETFRPNAVQGTTRAWEFLLPQGALAHGGAMVPAPGLRGLADEVMERDYEVTVAVDDREGTIVANIVPR